MTIYQDVLMAAEQLQGPFSQEEFERAELMCSAAVDLLSRRLRSGLTYADCRAPFVLAGALLTCSLLKTAAGDNLAGFTAGTLSLAFGEKNDHRARAAFELLAPWSADGTAFVGVIA